MRHLFVVGLALALPTVVLAEGKTPSFTRDVLPIMQNYCISCHKPGKTKGGLDLTEYESMFKSKKGKAMIVPGKPEKSRLVTTMLGGKPIMPPRKEKSRPTAAEIATIRAWIAAGAKNDAAPSR